MFASLLQILSRLQSYKFIVFKTKFFCEKIKNLSKSCFY